MGLRGPVRQKGMKAMAQRRRTSRYETYGNVALQPAREHRTQSQPARRAPRPEPRPRVRPRERTLVRPSIQVRVQEAVSPFAIVGFAAVTLCVVMLLMSYVQLAVLHAETVELREEMGELETEYKRLLTEYELAYDLTAIEEELISSGRMVRASSRQMIYLDLSEGDHVTYYAEAEKGLYGLVNRLERLIDELLE